MGSVYYCRLFVSPYGDQGLCEFETELLPAGARLLWGLHSLQRISLHVNFFNI